jgi:hypothetical protein
MAGAAVSMVMEREGPTIEALPAASTKATIQLEVPSPWVEAVKVVVEVKRGDRAMPSRKTPT